MNFFTEHTTLFLMFHLIGVALGMGGATITDILFFNFLRDYKISKKEAEVMGMLSNIIMGALVLLYLSGIALFLSNPEKFWNSPAFLAKATILIVLTANGLIMHKWIAPHMVHMSFITHPFESHRQMHTLRKLAFALGAISFTSWYSVFFIASLKSYTTDFALPDYLKIYSAVLLSAIITSQILQHYWHKHFLEK